MYSKNFDIGKDGDHVTSAFSEHPCVNDPLVKISNFIPFVKIVKNISSVSYRVHSGL